MKAPNLEQRSNEGQREEEHGRQINGASELGVEVFRTVVNGGAEGRVGTGI